MGGTLLGRLRQVGFGCAFLSMVAGLVSAPGVCAAQDELRPAKSELELKIVVGENPIAIGGIVSARVVVSNFGAEPIEKVQLNVLASPMLLPLGGRGATAVHIVSDEIVVEPLPVLGPRERAEWFVILGTDRAGAATISATTNTGDKAFLADASVNIEGPAPTIVVEIAETLLDRAKKSIEVGEYEAAINTLKSAVTLFDNPMFKATAYYLQSIALQRLGRVYEAHQQQQITRVLLSHSFTPASRWMPEIVLMSDLRDIETKDDDADTTLVSARAADSAVTGRVYVGSERNPIAGAIVSLDGAGGVATSTDDQGYFVLAGMPADYYSITVTKPGYKMRTRGNIDVRNSTTLRVDFRLAENDSDNRKDIAELAMDEGGRLVGRVVAAADLAPVGEVNVFFEGPQRVLVTTDRYGRFSVNGMTPGNYTATWSRAGFFKVTRFNIAVVAGQTTTLETELSSESTATARK